jgi:copper chaperone CopZ
MTTGKKWAKPAGIMLLLGLIGGALSIIYQAAAVEWERYGRVASSAPAESKATLVDEADSAGAVTPRTITLCIAPTDPTATLAAAAVASALQSPGPPVQSAVLESEPPVTAQVKIVKPIRLTLLNARLQKQGAEVDPQRSLLHGPLRLHVSGMTCAGCASALKGHLSRLEGVEVQRVGLFPRNGGYADVVIADKATLTIVAIRAAVSKKQPFQLADIEWPVARLSTTR